MVDTRRSNTNSYSSTLDRTKQAYLFQYLSEFEPLGYTFNQFCNDHCGQAFGSYGDSLRRRGRDRLRYLKALQNTDPHKFSELRRVAAGSLSVASPLPTAPSNRPRSPPPPPSQPPPPPTRQTVPSQPSSPSPSPRQTTPSPSRHPPKKISTVRLESSITMSDDEDCAPLGSIFYNKGILNLDRPEENEGVLPFLLGDVPYKGSMRDLCAVVVLLKEPRCLRSMEILWKSDFRSFTVKREIIGQNMVGQDAKTNVCDRVMEKLPASLMQLDGCGEDEATSLAARFCLKYTAWANEMCNGREKKPERRFLITHHKLPSKWTVEKGFFGHEGLKIKFKSFASPFTFGRADPSYSAYALFFVMIKKSGPKNLDPAGEKDAFDDAFG